MFATRKPSVWKRRSTRCQAQPAERFGLEGRGSIRERSYADIVVFDLATLNSESSFEHPAAYPEGLTLF